MKLHARFRSVFVILNPLSGTTHPKKVQKQIQAFLKPRTAALSFRVTLGEGDAAQYTEEARERSCDLLIVAAGDGTIREVFHTIANKENAPPIALIPVGSANILAWSLGIPLSVSGALALLDRGTPKAIDLGYLPERNEHFALMVTTGFHASVVKDTTRLAKRQYGFLAYFLATWRHLWHTQNAEATVTVDGVSRRFHTENIFIANAKPMGLESRRFHPKVRLDDGQLDVIIFQHAHVLRFLRLVLHILLTPMRPDPRLTLLHGQDIILDLDPSVSIQTDGDLIPGSHVHVQVVPQAVRVIVPEG